MVTALEFLLGGAALLLLLPVLVLFVEVALAVTAGRHSRATTGTRGSLAIIMPAHNEASMIAGSLGSVLPQLGALDRLIVVADNCSDETAMVAAACGAQVIIRADEARRGKGYALDFGVRHLERCYA